MVKSKERNRIVVFSVLPEEMQTHLGQFKDTNEKVRGKDTKHVILNSKVGKMKNMKEGKPNQGSYLARYARGCSNS